MRLNVNRITVSFIVLYNCPRNEKPWKIVSAVRSSARRTYTPSMPTNSEHCDLIVEVRNFQPSTVGRCLLLLSLAAPIVIIVLNYVQDESLRTPCAYARIATDRISQPWLSSRCGARHCVRIARRLGVVGCVREGDRSRRGLPAACYESCQSPVCNRYRGPEVGIGPIRSAPPRACRRPGRFIMLISLRQGSLSPPPSSRTYRALSARLSPPPFLHPLGARSSLFLFNPPSLSSSPLGCCTEREARESA